MSGTTTSAPSSRVRRLAGRTLRRLSGSSLGRRTFVRLATVGPARTRGAGRVGDVVDRTLSMSRGATGVRQASITALVDLFFNLVDSLDVERFVEAGAKEASASRRAVRLPSIREAVAFEANPFTHARFVKRVTKAGVRYEHLALDRQLGTATFFVRRTEDGRPMADGQGSLHRRTDYEPGHQEVSVDTVSLDDFLADLTPCRHAMWVDVEGASANVLEGAATTLASTDVVLIEVETRPFWDERQWLCRDVTEHLAAFDLTPLARDMQSSHQFNVLFLRRPALDDSVVETALERFRLACLEHE